MLLTGTLAEGVFAAGKTAVAGLLVDALASAPWLGSLSEAARADDFADDLPCGFKDSILTDARREALAEVA